MNWYMKDGPESDAAVSTRIRFARNIDGIKFIGTASKDDMKEVIKIMSGFSLGSNLKLYKLEDMDDITKISLVEKHLISPDIVHKAPDTSAIILSEDESISIMINEEDHLRIQVISTGLDLEKALDVANEIDEKIASNINYAYSEKYGYLTACPTNVGTGMRASVMLHLPALTMTKKVGQILDVVSSVGINVRGVYGEGSDALGDMYQISNKVSLGLSETEIIDNLKAIAYKIINQERNIRKLLFKQGLEFEDKLCRSYGILTNAKKLSSNECTRLISDVKLGINMGIIQKMDKEKINELMIITQPATMQKYLKKALAPEERDLARAEMVRKFII